MNSPLSPKLVSYLVIALALWLTLMSAGPTLVALANSAVPLVIAVGAVVVVLRLVFFHTRRW